MTKSKARQELERIVFGKDVSISRTNPTYVRIYSVPCIMQYKDTPRNIDVLTTISFKNKLKEKEVYVRNFNESIERYRSLLERFKKEGYRIERHAFFGPHLLRTD